MFSLKRIFLLLTGILFFSSLTLVNAQEAIPWLGDYTSEMMIGNNTYQYNFVNVDGNDCKVKFEELFTNKKGATDSHSWVFYLSDIDPASLRFNTRGKSVEVSMETRSSQKFISYYEGDEFDEYTAKIKLVMNEVDKSRKLIEALKEHIDPCLEAGAVWNDPNSAFNWLRENIGEAKDDDVQWEQDFSQGERPYLAKLSSKSFDNGKEEDFGYLFDLTDIEPVNIELVASGRTLNVEVPVSEGKDFIEVKSSDGTQYTDELKIYADDIEIARKMVYALSYLVSNTSAERPEWDSYEEALGFVKDKLGQVTIGDEKFHHKLIFETSPSGVLDMTIERIESDGESKELSYSFYLADIMESPSLQVSRKQIDIEVETSDNHEFITKSSGGSISGYVSEFEFNASGIDMARDIINAFTYAIQQSEEEIQAFSSVDEVTSWMEENLVPLFREGEKYEQKLSVDAAFPYLITFEQKLTEDESETTDKKYLIYPVDISVEDLKIDVSMGRLKVALKTEKKDYIKYFKDKTLEDYTDKTDVYFSDPLVAKNFMAAIRFLQEHAAGTETPEPDMEEALAFLNASILDIELPGEKYEQKLEIMDGDPCKLKFTRVETDEDGKSDEFIYEFTAKDISKANSELSVPGQIIKINLKTPGKTKLIKPYKNGEVEDFDNEVSIYSDDVWLAKQILAAFGVLSEGCK